jgi:hypothetical protein
LCLNERAIAKEYGRYGIYGNFSVAANGIYTELGCERSRGRQLDSRRAASDEPNFNKVQRKKRGVHVSRMIIPMGRTPLKQKFFHCAVSGLRLPIFAVAAFMSKTCQQGSGILGLAIRS